MASIKRENIYYFLIDRVKKLNCLYNYTKKRKPQQQLENLIQWLGGMQNVLAEVEMSKV